MNEQPTLSIVTPTLGKFSEYWLQQLLNVKGPVQFIFVYPPGISIKSVDDSRVKTLTSPYKGEVIQRFTGLLNASGKYVLALDDDDFVHPDVLKLTTDYFHRFPQSWVLRLKVDNIDYLNEELITRDWEEIPDVNQLEVSRQTQGEYTGLLELPIAPLDKNFDIRLAIWPLLKRTDMNGIHFENFNNRVWRSELVQQALADMSKTMKVGGALTWIPSWNLDRSLGLFVQAKFFQKGTVVGHWMPTPGQVRYIGKDPALKEARVYLTADALLVKRFPQYGYFWNLFFSQLYDLPRIAGKAVKMKFLKKQ